MFLDLLAEGSLLRKKRVSSEFCQLRFGRSLRVAVATLEDISNYTTSPLFAAGFVGREGVRSTSGRLAFQRKQTR